MIEATDITPEQIAAWQQQQRALEQQRLQECNKRLAALLQEFNCTMIAVPQIVDGRIDAVIQIVSKSQQ